MRNTAASNEHIGEIAAVSPQKRQCEFGSYYPARTFVKPLPRQYAGTLCVMRRQRCGQCIVSKESTTRQRDTA